MILKGVTVGENAVLGARSVVTSNVPDNAVVFGNPARVVWRVRAPLTSAQKQVAASVATPIEVEIAPGS
jgi:acetyltransferase-like isoleucine patch superfamily enzyme